MTAAPTGHPNVLRLVLAAIAEGAGSRAGVARHTGLSAEVVDAAVDHLVRTGRLVTTPLGGGCATGGCGSCPSGRPDGAAGCGAAHVEVGRGPVALTIAARPLRRSPAPELGSR